MPGQGQPMKSQFKEERWGRARAPRPNSCPGSSGCVPLAAFGRLNPTISTFLPRASQLRKHFAEHKEPIHQKAPARCHW